MKRDGLNSWKTGLLSLPPAGCSLGEISMAGMIRNSRGAGNGRLRVFGEWAFVYLVEGQGIYEDSLGTRQEVKAGNWILVFPELPHHYGPRPGERWNEVYVCFQGPVFEQWRKAGILDASRPVGELQPVVRWWKELARVLQQLENKNTSPLEAVTLWQHWMARVLSRHAHAKSEADLWIERACRLLDQGLGTEDSRGQKVAAGLGMGYENFRKKFVRRMGISPGYYRERLRIEKAKQLLQSKRMTNKELADMLGFCDEAHFSKTFLRLAGLSPRRYARSLH